jgi:hypothetical protein
VVTDGGQGLQLVGTNCSGCGGAGLGGGSITLQGTSQSSLALIARSAIFITPRTPVPLLSVGSLNDALFSRLVFVLVLTFTLICSFAYFAPGNRLSAVAAQSTSLSGPFGFLLTSMEPGTGGFK